MKINGINYQTIWIADNNTKVQIIDQRYLPFEFKIAELNTINDCYFAIREMLVRGAPLIGVTAAYGLYLALVNAPRNFTENDIIESANFLKSSRPTAVNLSYAVDFIVNSISKYKSLEEKIRVALEQANLLKQKEIDYSFQIGLAGLELIKNISKKKKGETVNILTHCNAGWLACVDYGTATAPIYVAHQEKINLHVWVDETRPRNQGARLTAFELGEEGIDYTIIPDNTGGHLMQHGKVDLVIVGCDRLTTWGDCANKIGTYLKALAAFDNQIPFYVALPTSTIDWNITDGIHQIPIEERDADEVHFIEGITDGELKRTRITPESSKAANYGFDVTPARLITGIITEKGIFKTSKEDLALLKSKI